MARKRPSPSARFTHPVEIEVRVPAFEPLATLASLDVKRLTKGTHDIEVGFFQGGCCPKLVRATVSKGMVTALKVDPCMDSEKPSASLSALLKEAVRHLPAGSGKWQPVAIEDFMAQAARLIVVWGGCIQICVWGHCITCCAGPTGFGCTTDPIYIGPL